jgi:protein TonB
VSDAISRLLVEREEFEHGLKATFLLSVSAHVALVGAAVIVPMLLPQEPLLRVADGFAVVLPRGGGGVPAAPAPPAQAPEVKPEPAAPPPQPVVLKPPPKAEPRPDALPLPNARSVKRPATPPPVRATAPTLPAASVAAGTTPAARGAATATPGLEFGPPGPGVPTGTDSGGDWYLAGVQQKIWMTWNQQIKAGYTQSVGVTFTILPDGQVTGVRVTEPSGVSLLDMAAQRAILNAAPFGPLPREYGQSSRTIQAHFRPTS